MQISILDKLAVVASKSSEMISDILSHAQAVTAEREVCEFRLGGLVADLLLVLDPLRQHSVVSEDIALVGDRKQAGSAGGSVGHGARSFGLDA